MSSNRDRTSSKKDCGTLHGISRCVPTKTRVQVDGDSPKSVEDRVLSTLHCPVPIFPRPDRSSRTTAASMLSSSNARPCGRSAPGRGRRRSTTRIRRPPYRDDHDYGDRPLQDAKPDGLGALRQRDAELASQSAPDRHGPGILHRERRTPTGMAVGDINTPPLAAALGSVEGVSWRRHFLLPSRVTPEADHETGKSLERTSQSTGPR